MYKLLERGKNFEMKEKNSGKLFGTEFGFYTSLRPYKLKKF